MESNFIVMWIFFPFKTHLEPHFQGTPWEYIKSTHVWSYFSQLLLFLIVQKCTGQFVCVCVCVCDMLEFEPRALNVLSKHCPTELHPQSLDKYCFDCILTTLLVLAYC
jgi:hypothetical protein